MLVSFAAALRHAAAVSRLNGVRALSGLVQLLDTLFGLLGCRFPPSLKALILQTLAAFAHNNPSFALAVWDRMERSQIIPTAISGARCVFGCPRPCPMLPRPSICPSLPTRPNVCSTVSQRWRRAGDDSQRQRHAARRTHDGPQSAS